MTTTNPGPGRLLAHLLGHVRPHCWTLSAGAALMLIGGVVTLAQPLVAKRFLDALAAGDTVLGPILLLGALLIGGAVVAAIGMYLIERTAESVVLSARRRLVSRLIRLRVDVVDRVQPGDLLARVTSDTTLLRAAATSNLVDLITGLFQLVGMVALMAYLDLALLGVVLGVLAVLVVAVAVLVPRIRNASQQAQEAVGGMGAVLERVLGAFRTVKANGAEQREIAAVYEAAHEAWRRGLRAARWVSVAGISTGLTVQVAFLVVLGVGGARVASGTLPVSTLIAFLLYLFYLTGPLTQLTGGITGIQVGLAAVRRIREIDEMPIEDTGVTDGAFTAPQDTGASVAFRDVQLRHTPDGPALIDGLSFQVPATGLTAIVGHSGAGKTTLFALLERFYDPSAGCIEVDGRDLRDWSLPELRAAIGYVEQDAPILAGTLRDNLLLAAPQVSDQRIREVLELTRLNAFVDRLPQGLDTQVGHRGGALSGGERQRIAMARALLRQPRLLLLDEVTSQLDAANEQALRDVVAEIARTTTVLTVAHRLSTVIGADRILVLDGGRIRAVGTHTELVRNDELYRGLATTQLLADGPGAPAHAAHRDLVGVA